MNPLLRKRILSKNLQDFDNQVISKTVLIVDFMNLFYRNYLAVKTFDIDGFHCGGVMGTLISLKSVIKQFAPSVIYICYEGKDSTKKKRSINENYKGGRVGPRQSPFKEDEYIKELPEESFSRQYLEVKKLLELLPVYHLEEEGLEADDLISFLWKFHENDFKIISSVDKDFYQLIDKNTLVFNPLTKKYIDTKFVLDKFGIHPLNFAQSRAFMGDSSDNLQGIKGVQEKTLVKIFPFVNEEKEYELDYFFKYLDFSMLEPDKKPTEAMQKKLDDMVTKKEDILKNFQIMDLRSNRQSHNVANLITHITENKTMHFNLKDFINILIKRYKISTDYITDWMYTFTRLSND